MLCCEADGGVSVTVLLERFKGCLNELWEFENFYFISDV